MEKWKSPSQDEVTNHVISLIPEIIIKLLFDLY